MTKRWGRHSSLAPPVIAYLPSRSSVVKQDYHLDFTTGAQPCNAQANSPRARLSSPAPRWESYPSPWPVHDPHREAKFQVEPVVSASTSMDRAMHIDQDNRPVSFYPAPRPDLDATTKNHPVTHNSWDQEENAKGNRKKNYQRYPKPPYSYLAMIAMVIQNSPEKKLTLSQILKEISTLFPFFKGDYKGWRDSVRHNLSSYDCFVKVLKDPGKPQGKGNFWAVEVSRVPLELLKRQNTAVSRQDETVFGQDLAPYILQGQAHQTGATPSPPPSMPTRAAPPLPEEPFRPKLDSSFAIDSLLHSLRPTGAAGDGERAGDCWLQGPLGPPSVSRPRRSSSSAHSVSASPASSSSDEDWRGGFHPGKRAPATEAGSEGFGDSCPPHRKSSRRSTALPWELPTSYAKYAPPNVVAPPSMRFNGGPFLPLRGLPYYSYGPPSTPPAHFVSHSYWPLLPSGRVPLQAPPLLMDLDRLLQSVPPNKSVFDVLGPRGPQTHPQPGPYDLQSRNPQY